MGQRNMNMESSRLLELRGGKGRNDHYLNFLAAEQMFNGSDMHS